MLTEAAPTGRTSSATLRVDGPFHVGILLENTPEYLFLLAGAAWSGAVVVGINPTRRGTELAADVRQDRLPAGDHRSTQRHLLDGLDLGIDHDRARSSPTTTPTGPPSRGGRAGPTNRRGTAHGRSPLPTHLHLRVDRRPKAVRMTQGRAARSAAPACGFRSRGRPLLRHAALPRQRALAPPSCRPLPAAPRWPCAGTFSASAFLDDVRETRSHLLQHGRAGHLPTSWPPRPPSMIATTSSVSCSDPRRRRRQVRVHASASVSRSSRGTARAKTPSCSCPCRTRDRAHWARPRTRRRGGRRSGLGHERPRAVFDPDGPAPQSGRGIGELVGRTCPIPVRGLLQQPRGRGRAHTQRLVLVGRSGLPRRRGHLLLCRPDAATGSGWTARTSPPRRWNASSDRFAGVRGVAVYAVPDSRTGDQVMAALEIEPGAAFDPTAFSPFSPPSRTSAPSGRHGT